MFTADMDMTMKVKLQSEKHSVEPSEIDSEFPFRRTPSIAVIVPCYRVARHILDVIARIGPECSLIYVVDDKCPEYSGQIVERECLDKRVRVIRHDVNKGVGGATLTGIRQALIDGAEVVVKIDGDGQMDPTLIERFVRPILEGDADYTKGNRFFNPEDAVTMPGVRLLGNAALSFITKLSTGYWNIFDPTNGFIAIHRKVAVLLPFEKISERFFFETDMLFRLNVLRAAVVDIPMKAVYKDEKSNLKVTRELFGFLLGHGRIFAKRVFYNYFLRNFSLASIELVLGSTLILFGLVFGIQAWIESTTAAVPATAGTVMVGALPIIIGTQLLLSFVNFDIEATPKSCLHKRL